MQVTTIDAGNVKDLRLARSVMYDGTVFIAFLDYTEASQRVKETLTSDEMVRYFDDQDMGLVFVEGTPISESDKHRPYVNQPALTYVLHREGVVLGSNMRHKELGVEAFKNGIDSMLDRD